MSYDKEQALKAEIAELLKAEETKQVDAPAVAEATPAVEMSEIEKQARELGWKTKEERTAEGKDNAHYISPEEYVSRKPLFVRLDKQAEELKKLKEAQRQSAAHMAKVRQEAYDQALADLENRRDKAVAEADIAEYNRLKAQTNHVQQQRAQDPIVNNPEIAAPQDPAIAEFSARNAHWYNNSTKENSKMAAAATAVDNFLATQARIDGQEINPKAHLAAIEAEVKRLFPHRFEQAAPAVVAKIETPAPVATTAGRSTAPISSAARVVGNLANRLTPSQKTLGERFLRDNPAFTLEVYAAELEKMGRLG